MRVTEAKVEDTTGDDEEQRRPEVRHVRLGLGLPRVPSDERLEQVLQVAPDGFGGRIDERLVDRHRELEHAVALAVRIRVQPRRRLLDHVRSLAKKAASTVRSAQRARIFATPASATLRAAMAARFAAPAEAMAVSASRSRPRATSASEELRRTSRSARSRTSASCASLVVRPWRRRSGTGVRGSPAVAGHAPPGHGRRGPVPVPRRSRPSVASRWSLPGEATSSAATARRGPSGNLGFGTQPRKRPDDLTGGLDVGEEGADLLDSALKAVPASRQRRSASVRLRGGVLVLTTRGAASSSCPALRIGLLDPLRAAGGLGRGRRAVPCQGRSTSPPGRRSGSRRSRARRRRGPTPRPSPETLSATVLK